MVACFTEPRTPPKYSDVRKCPNAVTILSIVYNHVLCKFLVTIAATTAIRMPLTAIAEFLARHRPRRIVEPDAIQAAVAVVLATHTSGDPELLLIKRAEHEGDPWSGQMALPGGRREALDADLMQTARRETLEETGIDLSGHPLLGELDDLHPRSKVLPPIVVRPFVFGVADRPDVRVSDEVTLHLWVPLSELRASSRRSQVVIRGVALEVASYVLGPHVVWGMTERILKPIIELTD